MRETVAVVVSAQVGEDASAGGFAFHEFAERREALDVFVASGRDDGDRDVLHHNGAPAVGHRSECLVAQPSELGVVLSMIPARRCRSMRRSAGEREKSSRERQSSQRFFNFWFLLSLMQTAPNLLDVKINFFSCSLCALCASA